MLVGPAKGCRICVACPTLTTAIVCTQIAQQRCERNRERGSAALGLKESRLRGDHTQRARVVLSLPTSRKKVWKHDEASLHKKGGSVAMG